VHAKVKGGILAFCELGYWTKADGSPKFIRARYLPRSKLATMAEYCGDYDDDGDREDVQV
jgi:hypothetical protein